MNKHLLTLAASLLVTSAAGLASAADATVTTSTSTSTSTPAATTSTTTTTTTDTTATSSADDKKKKGTAFELGLAVGLNVSTSKLGVGPGIALDLGPRFRVGSGLLAIHLRTQYQSYGKDDTIASTCSSDANGVPSSPCMKDGSLGYSLKEQSLDFALRLQYRLFADQSWTPYFGLAPKLYLLKAKTTALDLDNTETGTKFGFALFGGALVDLGPGHAFGELEYQWATLDHQATGDAHLAGLALIIGYHLAI